MKKAAALSIVFAVILLAVASWPRPSSQRKSRGLGSSAAVPLPRRSFWPTTSVKAYVNSDIYIEDRISPSSTDMRTERRSDSLTLQQSWSLEPDVVVTPSTKTTLAVKQASSTTVVARLLFPVNEKFISRKFSFMISGLASVLNSPRFV
jgi:hypothetical protein